MTMGGSEGTPTIAAESFYVPRRNYYLSKVTTYHETSMTFKHFGFEFEFTSTCGEDLWTKLIGQKTP